MSLLDDMKRKWRQKEDECRAAGMRLVSGTINALLADMEAALAGGGEAVAWVSAQDCMFDGNWSATTPILYSEKRDGCIPLFTQPAVAVQVDGQIQQDAEEALDMLETLESDVDGTSEGVAAVRRYIAALNPGGSCECG